MPYEPYIIHLITGRRYLLVSVAASYAKTVAVHNFIRCIALKACSKSLRMIKAVIIELRLGMMMRRI